MALQKNLAGKVLGTCFCVQWLWMALSTKPLGAGVVWLNLSGDHCSRAAKGSCTCGFLLCLAWQEGPSEADWVEEDLCYKDSTQCQVLQVSGAVIFHIHPAFCVLLQLHHFSSQATVFPAFSFTFVELCSSVDKPFSVLLSQLSWFQFYQHKINEFFLLFFFSLLGLDVLSATAALFQSSLALGVWIQL